MSERRTLFKPENLRAKLAENKCKMTPQRREILNVFVADSGKSHFSADEVFDELLKKNFNFGIATVYRNVELLNSLGILTKIDFGDGRARYELSSTDPKVHNHHHLLCVKCKKIIEFEEDLLDDLEKVITEKSGFKIFNHEVKFFGFCKECQEKDGK